MIVQSNRITRKPVHHALAKVETARAMPCLVPSQLCGSVKHDERRRRTVDTGRYSAQEFPKAPLYPLLYACLSFGWSNHLSNGLTIIGHFLNQQIVYEVLLFNLSSSSFVVSFMILLPIRFSVFPDFPAFFLFPPLGRHHIIYSYGRTDGSLLLK
jgi:hypothetical protein